jgi:hypothetical protein
VDRGWYRFDGGGTAPAIRIVIQRDSVGLPVRLGVEPCVIAVGTFFFVPLRCGL